MVIIVSSQSSGVNVICTIKRTQMFRKIIRFPHRALLFLIDCKLHILKKKLSILATIAISPFKLYLG